MKKRLLRCVCLAIAVWGGLELLGNAAVWVICRMGHVSHEAASVGIIGGADGPTAIFLAYSKPPVWNLVLPVFLVTVGIWGWLRLQKK